MQGTFSHQCLLRIFCILIAFAGIVANEQTSLAAQAPTPLQEHQTRYAIQIFVRSGETAVFLLPQNGSTGYLWQLEPLSADAAVEPAGEESLLKDISGNAVGAGGAKEWRFKALKPGHTFIRAAYVRPWEKPLRPVITAKVEIVVSDF